MRKAVAHIFLLGLLLQAGLANAIVLPHTAMRAATTQKERPQSKLTGDIDPGNSQISKDLVINDWEDFDECEHDDHTTSFNGKSDSPASSSAKENLLAVSYIRQRVSGKIYTDQNCSRLPRYNYISLRVLRI